MYIDREKTDTEIQNERKTNLTRKKKLARKLIERKRETERKTDTEIQSDRQTNIPREKS
jgi:hypothetical protein